jgi:hypothetical protein
MRRMSLLVVASLLVLGGAAWFLFLRPGVSIASSVDPGVTIECSSSLGVDEAACRGLGDAMLEAGPPSTTFELEDVVRIRLDRGLFGGECRIEYFLSRYPDEATWAEPAACGVTESS